MVDYALQGILIITSESSQGKSITLCNLVVKTVAFKSRILYLEGKNRQTKG